MTSILPGSIVTDPDGASSRDESWSEQWRKSYGPHWRLLLAVLGLLLIIRGFIETLGDADLPMHLALGEWIVRHRAVPVVEPFAWTRAGSPFYAYSWAMDALVYLVAEAGGKLGLRLLNGLLTAGAFASMIVLGRAAHWDPRTSLVMGVLNVALMSVIVNAVRPQALLFTLIPLAWAFSYNALESARPRRGLIGLLGTSVVAANTHIFFPLTAVPWLLWMAKPPREKWRIYAVVAATVAGWLVSPYALLLPDVLRFSTQSNPMLTPPSSILETQPGFVAMWLHWALVPIVLFLTTLPWIWPDRWRSGYARLVWATGWLIGIVAFASAVRLMLVWWMLVLPLVAATVERIADRLLATEDQAVRLWRITAVWAVCAVLLLSLKPFDPDAWRFESPEAVRRLGSMEVNGLDRVAHWLECNTRPNARGRVFTDFNFGSALTWRLPRYSMSVDGRTIFPDSVAKAESFYDPFRVPLRLGPWRSADLAIMPVPSAIADVLDNADGWRRAAVAHTADASTALWVTDTWWARSGSSPLPQRPVSLMPGDAPDSTGSCRSLPPS